VPNDDGISQMRWILPFCQGDQNEPEHKCGRGKKNMREVLGVHAWYLLRAMNNSQAGTSA
jgi:hypothetical protein